MRRAHFDQPRLFEIQVPAHACAPASAPRPTVWPTPDTEFGRARLALSAERAVRDEAAIERVVTTYMPAGVPATTWHRVHGLVRKAVLATKPATPRSAETLMSVVAQFLLWCDTQAVSGREDVTFHPATIDRYILRGCKGLTAATKANYRSRLHGVGAALLGPPMYPGPRLHLPRGDVHRPYTQQDISALLGIARGYPTPRMRENSLALLALGRGAGLAPPEILRIVGTDVVDRGDGGVDIRVPGSRPRLVTVERRWEQHVLNRARAVGERPMFLPNRTSISRRDISNFTGSLPIADAPPLVVTRLRAAWIVALLQRSVPLASVARAAGIEATQVAKFATYMTIVAADEERLLLRGDT